jgi:uncharacterized RDD family membrane protein YckC
MNLPLKTHPDDPARLEVHTPERVTLHLPLAGVGSRFVAQLFDDIIRFSTAFLLALLSIILIVAFSHRSLHFIMKDLRTWLSALLGLLIVFLFLGFYFGYDLYYEAYRNGQTPGKKFQHIRVVMDSGQAVTPRAAFIRSILGIVDSLPSYYLLGGLLCLIRKDRKRLGDLVAGTSVIRVDSPFRAELSHAPNPREEFIFTKDMLAKLTTKDYHTLLELRVRSPENLQEKKTMSSHDHELLAEKICANFMKRLGHATLPCSKEDYLLNLEIQLKRELDKQY